MKATSQYGALAPITQCFVIIPGSKINKEGAITFNILPEITDRKSAHYNDVPIIGRSYPIKTFSHGDNRVITMKAHFVVLEEADIQNNFLKLRALQSLVYPQDGNASTPYLPPPIAQLRCGYLLSDATTPYLCVVLTDYSVSFPTDVVWDDDSLLPYKFDVDLTWQVVFPPSALPGNQMILNEVGPS